MCMFLCIHLHTHKDMRTCTCGYVWTFTPHGFASSPTWAQFPAVLAQIPAAGLPPYSAGQTLFSLLIKWKRLKGEHGFLSQRVQPEHQGRVVFFCNSTQQRCHLCTRNYYTSTPNDHFLTKTQRVQRVQNNNDAFVVQSSLRCFKYLLFHHICPRETSGGWRSSLNHWRDCKQYLNNNVLNNPYCN